MKRQNLLYLLTMLISLISVNAYAHDIEEKNSDGQTIYYNYIRNDNNLITGLEVTYRGDTYNTYSNEYSGKIVIPAFVGTHSVTRIRNNAFSGCSGLTSITIPNRVTFIGEGAFKDCTGLTSITIPNSVLSIYDSAFSGCSGLKTITIPNSVLSIYNSAFSGCSGLTSITIPNSVISINDSAFKGCSGLKSVTLHCSKIGSCFSNHSSIEEIVFGEEVTTIDEGAFYNCTGLTSITIPNSVISIDDSAFKGCSGLKSVTLHCTEIGSCFRNHSSIQEIVFGEEVTSIGESAFRDCTGLSSITIPNSVTSIGESAFYNCTGLTSITIPNSVTSIGNAAFEGCSGLTSLKVESSNREYDSRDDCNAIIHTETNKLICGTKNTIIPNSVTSIGESAFRGCSGLTSITIPNSVISIGEYAFRGCSGLTSITISNRVTSIGHGVFYNCYGLTSITIPNSVTSIGESAFYNCYGLTSITIPNTVTSIGNSAFYNCYGLTSITIPNSVTSIGNAAFYRCSFLTSITIPNSVTSIGNYAFRSCSFLTSITIPNSVKTIGDEAFDNCSRLKSITIPNSVTSIGKLAFDYCEKLTQVIVESKTPLSITGDEFSNRTGATLYVPAGSKAAYASATGWKEFRYIILHGDYIDQQGVIYSLDTDNDTYYVSDYTNQLSNNITIPSSINGRNVTSIGDLAFQNCSRLTSITIPQSVTSIGTNPFKACNSLSSITVESGNTIYDSRNNCNAIIKTASNTLITGCKNTVIPNSVTSIGSSAFSGCSALTSITIPESVTSIGERAFENCSGLTYVMIKIKTPLTITNNVFTSKFNVILTVPAGSKAAYKAADYWKGFKEIREILIYTGYAQDLITADASNMQYSLDGTNYGTTIPQGIAAKEYTVYYKNGSGGPVSTTKVTIYPKTVSSPTIILNQTSYTYDGTAKEPTVTVMDGETGIYAKEYTVSYSNNINPGTATVTITDKEGGNYIVSGSTTFTIVEPGESAKFIYSINPDEITCTITGYTDACTGDVTIPFSIDGYSVISIGESAFEECSSLTSITIPNSVTSIAINAFKDCSGLTSVTVKAETPLTITDGVFTNRTKATLYVPAGSKAAYEAADYWKEFKEIKEIGMTSPTGITGLIYTGSAQDLINAGASNMRYSLDGTNYGTTIPQGTDATEYTVYYKVEGNESVSTIKVTISPKTVSSPTISLSQTSYTYDGTAKEPTVTVKDGETTISAEEYAVGYSNNTNAGTATVTISDKEGGNYNVSGSSTFTIERSVPSGNIVFANDKVKAACVAKWDTDKDGELSYDEAAAVTSLVDKNDANDPFGELWELGTENSEFSFDEFQYFTGVTSLAGHEFECNNLTSIILPNSITSIGDGTFYLCKKLTSIHIPASVTAIYMGSNAPAFNPKYLQTITVDPGNTKYASPEGSNAIIAIFDEKPKTLILGCGNTDFTKIPNTVTTIEQDAFAGVTFANPIVSLPTSVKAIKSYAFEYSNITSINLGELSNLTTIGNEAFSDCKGLTEVTLPASITSMGISVFANCYNLVKVVSNIEEPFNNDNHYYSIYYYIFAIYNDAVLYVPAGKVQTYIDKGWKEIDGDVQSFRVITDGDYTPPVAREGLVYGDYDIWMDPNKEGQRLIYPGAYRDGMMEYSLDGSTYSTSVPTGKDAGEYTVYYRKKGLNNVSTLKVTIAAPKTISVFSGSNLWAGYVATENLAIPTGLEAYVITNLGATTATASSLNYIPQGVPVLLKRNNASVNDYEISTGTGTAPTVNLLKTYDSDKSVSNREGFILYNDEFVLVNEGTLPAGRVFLPANGSGRALTRTIVFDRDDIVDFGDSQEKNDDSNQWYDIQGRKLERKPTKKGIYILDGRKVVIK